MPATATIIIIFPLFIIHFIKLEFLSFHLAHLSIANFTMLISNFNSLIDKS